MINKLRTMPFTSTKDTEFGNCHFAFSKTDKLLIRAMLKTYERTGLYVLLKLFKKAAEEYLFEQRNSQNRQEFGCFVNTLQKILESVVQEKSAKDCSAKLSPKRPKFQNEILRKDGGSNVSTFSELLQTFSESI